MNEEKNTPSEMLRKTLEGGEDAVGAINIAESLLRIVAEGIMSVDEALVELGNIKKDIQCYTANVTEMDDEEEICVVRRLTPTETARLQGFPDDYTKIDGPDTSDAPQFKAHGNSWATPCANFVSTRIELELRRLGHKGTIRYATCCSGIEAHSIAVRNLDWKSMFFSEIEPFPCRVLATHYPTTPNLGDMTQIHFDAEKGCISNAHKEGEEYSMPSCFKEAPIQELPFKVGDLEVFSGGTPCFTAGHMVLTESGYRPIETIREGDMVMTHQGRLRKVLAIGAKVAENIVDVTIATRQKIRCTDDHKFWAAVRPHQDFRRHSATYLQILFDGMEFQPISRVGVGGYVAQMNEYETIPMPQIPNIYNAEAKDIIELAGWYVGDGHCVGFSNKKHKKVLVLSLSESKVEKFRARFNGIVNFNAYPHNKNGVYRVQVANSELCDWLVENFGHLAQNKNIPAWLICSSDEHRQYFLDGYMATDGFVSQKGNIGFACSTTSHALALGLADLVGKCAIYKSNLPATKVMYDGRVVNQRPFWNVRRSNKPNRFHDYGKWSGVRVRKIEKKPPETVYNITVEDDHGYIVNGICVSNCQSISIAGKREGMAEGSGTRSSLAFHYQRIIDESRPVFTLWENVPGAFSSNGGADFIWFVNRCAESGYAMAWRVLDAQYTMTEEFPRAVPQRRRRIWLVGFRENDWRVPARIVFELEKDLTANPPVRVPGLGFKELSEEGRKIIESSGESSVSTTIASNQLGLAMESDDGQKELLKVSRLIDFSEMPEESDFSKVSMADIFAFAKKIGDPGYIGSVFRTDKKKKAKKVDDSFDLFSMMNGEVLKEEEKEEPAKDETEEWEGAEKITPAILENIGNAGILSNGRICTMNCHEWTSGIQLSPKTYNAWEEVVKYNDWLKANDLLPEAYDETVCGLSDILVEDPDEKYNLSWRACFGILRRAEARGKELPPALEIALICTIRDNAGIVKWFALNGKDTKKKETDFSEREIARLCFEKYISSVVKFEEVEAEQPKRKNDGESDVEEDIDDDDIEFDEDGNPILKDEEFGMKAETPISH